MAVGIIDVLCVIVLFFVLMIRRPPRSTQSRSSAASDVYKRQNQSILIHNLKEKNAPKDLLTEEAVELLTSPLDLATYNNAITEAMFKGTKRDVVGEDNSKNAEVE